LPAALSGREKWEEILFGEKERARERYPEEKKLLAWTRERRARRKERALTGPTRGKLQRRL